VSGDQREAAAPEVAREQAFEESLAIVVKRGERLVEDPERGRVEREASQADPPSLPG
jgi:hypothetical protein